MKAFDFLCPKGHTHEEMFGELDPKRYEATVPCGVDGCTEIAQKVLVYATPGVLLPSSPGSYHEPK